MLASNFFTTKRLKEMREEISRDGFLADKFLADLIKTDARDMLLMLFAPFPLLPISRLSPFDRRVSFASLRLCVEIFPLPCLPRLYPFRLFQVADG